eukprot:scaffold1504_cov111-Isochrysis_galbana.AAC.3
MGSERRLACWSPPLLHLSQRRSSTRRRGRRGPTAPQARVRLLFVLLQVDLVLVWLRAWDGRATSDLPTFYGLTLGCQVFKF